MRPAEDTIYAMATASPSRRSGSGIAVFRLSGSAAAQTLLGMLGTAGLPPPQRASLRRLAHPVSRETIDRGLVVWFPGPHSFTGEDYAELHVHGGRAVIAAVLEALSESPGCRLAQPGEFARRSFSNGKLDLTAAEGIADLVAAETDAQRRQALRQMEGELGRLYDGWRGRLVGALAHIEAEIDFPDEDLPQGIAASVLGVLEGLREEIRRHLADRRGERLRDGICIAIVGAPNVGKSSLLNRLARREAAIVSATPGTTRDIVEVHLDLGGFPVMLIDTAGLRESDDPVEQEGVRRARLRAQQADLRLIVWAVGEDGRLPSPGIGAVPEAAAEDIVIVNKIDLMAEGAVTAMPSFQGRDTIAVSAMRGTGLAELVVLLQAKIEQLCTNNAINLGENAGQTGLAESPPLTQHRHREALVRCATALDQGLKLAGVDSGSLELIAEDLRMAARELGRITGRVDVEDILDVVFHDFCIGK